MAELVLEWVEREGQRPAVPLDDERPIATEDVLFLVDRCAHIGKAASLLREALARAMRQGIEGEQARKIARAVAVAARMWLDLAGILRMMLTGPRANELSEAARNAIGDLEADRPRVTQWRDRALALVEFLKPPSFEELEARRAAFEKQHPPTGKKQLLSDVIAELRGRGGE